MHKGAPAIAAGAPAIIRLSDSRKECFSPAGQLLREIQELLIRLCKIAGCILVSDRLAGCLPLGLVRDVDDVDAVCFQLLKDFVLLALGDLAAVCGSFRSGKPMPYR